MLLKLASILAFMPFFCMICAAGCNLPQPGPDGSEPGPESVAGPVRLTVESISVPRETDKFIRIVTDEAEKFEVAGFIWSGKPKEIKLVVEGDKREVTRFFDYIVGKGREMRVLASYTVPEWSPATGRYKHFIWNFSHEPPD